MTNLKGFNADCLIIALILNYKKEILRFFYYLSQDEKCFFYLKDELIF
jgi:hypothetical protein